MRVCERNAQSQCAHAALPHISVALTSAFCWSTPPAQFGPGPLPQHGFARNSLWHLGATNVVQASGDISTEFILEDSAETRAVWPHKFRLTLTVLLKPTSLSMQLRVQNLNDQAEEGSANKDASFPFTALLHTYLGVDDIARTSVRGLQGKQYIDQLESDKSKQLKTQHDELVRFDSGEVDAKYLDCNAAWVRDGGNCELAVRTTGFRDFVVWNPHIVKTAGMADMPADAWKTFVCVEAGTVQTPVELAAGKQWEGAQGISIAMMPETQQQVAERTLGQQKL